MKHGFLKGHKVAECQNSQTQLMARFLKDGVVDQWCDVEDAPAKKPPAPEAITPPQDTPAPDINTPPAPSESIPDFDSEHGEEVDGASEQSTEESANEKAKRGKRRD